VAVATVSSITFITPLASSMFAPGIKQVMVELKSTNTELASFVVSVFLLGFAVGPLFLAPASELWGRRIIYNVSNIFFVLCTVGCALAPTLNFLIGFRFLSGVFGAAPLTLGGGTISDVIPAKNRGVAMALFAMGPLLGPVVGPVAGGFLAEAEGWRWVFWVLTICAGVVTIVTFIFLRETYAPKILADKAARLRKETGNPKLRSKLASPLPAREVFIRAMSRPFKMLFTSPIVLFMSLHMALAYGYLYLLFTTFPTVFEGQYGFSAATVGLAYLGIGCGSLFGLLIIGLVSDRILASLSAKTGVMKPEYRLPPMAWGSPLIPMGLFWYGWSADKNVHWIVPIIGTSLVGMGLLATFMPVNTYMVDAFQKYAASALAATTVLRSVFGACLPLAGPKMYDSLGLGWGNSLLGFVALLFLPVPFIFQKYGERLRTKFPVGFE
jgi:multidrug resistance protein